jgi:hypothetical protein
MMSFFRMSREGYAPLLHLFCTFTNQLYDIYLDMTMEDDPLFKAFDNPGIFRHIIQYLLVKKRYFVAVNENARDIGHRGQLCRIEMKSRYRWLPNQGGVGIVDGEEDYMTTEIIPMFTPSMSELWTPARNYGAFNFAIDNDSGTIAIRSFCGNNHFITFYTPGQDPKFVVLPLHLKDVIDICVVKTTVFVSTFFSFGCVDFAVEEPRFTPIIDHMLYEIYFNLAKTDRFIFGLRARSNEDQRTECKEIDCLELTTNQMPELKHSWIIRSPNENPNVYLDDDFQFLAIVDQGDSFCVVFMTPNCNRDASLINAYDDGNVGVWMLTRIMVSKLQDAVIEEVRLPLNPGAEASGMIIRESSKKILIAAGRHGLLIVPLLFDSDTRPRRLMKPTNNQTILGVQLFNNIPYVFVKEEDENDIDSYSIIKVGAASNISQVSRSIPTGSRDASYERMM